MLIKKELLKIEPIADFGKKKKRAEFYVYAVVKRLKKCGRVLAVFAYNTGSGKEIFRYFGDKKSYIIYADGEWSRKQIRDYWGWRPSCEYYGKSKEIIEKFYPLQNYGGGICTLSRFITDYNAERRYISLKNKQDRINAKISSVPKYPSLLPRYCEKNILTFGTIFISKAEGKKRKAACGSCGAKYKIDDKAGIKSGAETVCPKCGRKSYYRLDRYAPPVDKFKIVVTYRRSDEVIYEWMKAERTYIYQQVSYRFEPYFYAFENPGGFSFYKWDYQGRRWKESDYWYSYEKTYVYTSNLNRNIKDRLGYVDSSEFKKLKKPIYFLDTILNLRHPITEQLIKAGYWQFAASSSFTADKREWKSFAQTFGVNGQYAPIYRELDVDIKTHEFLKSHNDVFLSGEYISKLSEILDGERYGRFADFVNEHKIPLKKGITYVYNQMRKLKRKSSYIMTLYGDYEKMSGQLGAELKSKSLKYPPNIKKAHDEAACKVEIKTTAEELREFEEKTAELYKTFISYESDGFVVVRPKSRADFIREGQVLSHCVGRQGSYYRNHVAGKALILFIRKEKDPDKPYVTLELDCKELKIKQMYGRNDTSAPPKVKTFVNKYIREIKKIKENGGNKKCRKTA